MKGILRFPKVFPKYLYLPSTMEAPFIQIFGSLLVSSVTVCMKLHHCLFTQNNY